MFVASRQTVEVSLPQISSTLVNWTIQTAICGAGRSGLAAASSVVPPSVAKLARGVIQTMILQSIKVPTVVALMSAGILGTVVLGNGSDGRKKRNRSDRQRSVQD